MINKGLYLMAVSENYMGRVQVLRFFAAAAVLFAHLQHEVMSHFPSNVEFKPFLLIDGGLGVDLFFVISGFIMYHVSVEKFGIPGATKDFLLRRYLRIAPLYYIATVLMLAVTAMFSDEVSIARPQTSHIAASFLFFPTLNLLGQIVPVLKLGWTLNFEAYFYVVFAISLTFNRRDGLILMTVVLTVMVMLAYVLPRPPVPIAFWGQSLAFEFLSGVGVAMLHHRGLKFRVSVAMTLIAAGVLLIAGMRMMDLLSSLPRAVYAGLSAWLIVTAVVCAPFDQRQGPLKRFLAAGGEASFAIYVFHPFLIRAGALIWTRLAPPASPWLYIALLMIVVIGSAFVINQLIERPLDRWLRRWLDAPRKQPSLAA